jgi:hypothetical protein
VLPSPTPSTRGANLNPPTGGSNPASVIPTGAPLTPAFEGSADAPVAEGQIGSGPEVGLPPATQPSVETGTGSPAPPKLRID